MTTYNANSANPLRHMLKPWVICIMGMLFYCFNYFLRSSSTALQADLTQTFHITATQFGTLIAFYYYAYTPMQVPAGMIYDKYGARFVLFLACLTAVLGLSIFVSADTFGVACAGRFLIGLGTAFAYIGVLKLASLWLPANRFATVAGLTTAFGMICGALSQRYLTKTVEAIGYKHALHGGLLIGIILSIAILFIVRSRPKQPINPAAKTQAPMNFGQLMRAVRRIAVNPQMWLIGIIGCLLYLPSTVFLDVWSVPYFKSVYGFTAAQAVNVSGIAFFGWILGGPVIGAFSDKIKRRRTPLILTGVVAAFLLCIIFYVPGLSITQLEIMFFIIGFCLGAHPLCFALGKENNPAPMSGTAVAVTNMLIMAGGMIFLPFVGLLLDLHTTSPIGPNTLPVYSGSDYTFALSIIPLGVVLAIILSAFLKETYCESQAKEADEKIFAPRPAVGSIVAEARGVV